MNKNHLLGSKFVCVILLIVNFIINIPIFMSNATNPLYALAFYSLWGTTTAFLAIIFSCLAMSYEGWFKIAFITTEISYSVNIIVVFVFWLVLWPGFMSSLEGVERTGEITFLIWYQGLIHAIPFITTVLDLWMTDMALEKSHWWISMITMFPCYMIPNWIGSMT